MDRSRILFINTADRSANAWADLLARRGFEVHVCSPAEVPMMLRTAADVALIVTVNRPGDPLPSPYIAQGRPVPVLLIRAEAGADRGDLPSWCSVLARPVSSRGLIDAVRAHLPSSRFAAEVVQRELFEAVRQRAASVRADARQLCDAAKVAQRRAWSHFDRLARPVRHGAK